MIRFHTVLLTFIAGASISSAVGAQQPDRVIKGPVRPSTGAERAAIGRSVITRGTTRTVLAGTNETAFSSIQGNALSATNGSLPNTVVRLRDARMGGIVDTQLTDRSGLFAFRTVDPGSYVVELMGNDHSVLAASQVLDVEAGHTLSAVVRLPFRLPPLAGILGHSAPEAATITSAAAAAGVLATSVTADAASPQ